MKLKTLVVAFAALALTPAAAMAQGMWDRVTNMETAGAWDVMPERPRPRVVDSGGQLFPQALRVQTSRGANQWDRQATTVTGADIAQGDTVMVMLLARAEEPAEGGSRLPVRLQLRGAPYTGLVESTFNLTGEWRAYCMSGIAQQAFAQDASTFAAHLATAEQTLDLGPVFIFNFGQNFELARVPACPETLR